MENKRFYSPDKILVFIMVLVTILVGCTVGETANVENNIVGIDQTPKPTTSAAVTPTPTSEIIPTRTLDLFRPDTIRATYAAKAAQNAAEPTSTPTPFSTSTLNPEQLCQPFPEDIQFLGSTKILGYPAWTLLATCKGKSTHLQSPVGEMTLFDYTALTGRFAYGSQDPTEGGLWVYDYWIELSEKWLNDHVIKAEWAPIKNSEDIQFLVILNQDGALSVSSEPFQNHLIASEVTHFSISPKGDQVAYVKENVIYVVPILGGQSRKLANGVNGTPRWSLAQNAIIFPSSPIKIAYLDGTGSFIPQETSSITQRIEYLCDGKPNCSLSSSIDADQVLWDGTSHLVVFYANKANDEVNFQTVYVYELSDDLKKIVNRQTVFGDFTNQIRWNIPGESIIDNAGNEATFGSPPEIFMVYAKINSIEEDSFIAEFMWTNPWNSSRYGHQFTHVTIKDTTQVIDSNGHLTSLESLKVGMTINLTARKLSAYTLSLFAYKIQISCDQLPCYLGFEGRS